MAADAEGLTRHEIQIDAVSGGALRPHGARADEGAALGARVAAWTAGPLGAPTLLMCHGGGLDHTGFRPLVGRYRTAWRVVLFDLPGHGESAPLLGRFTAKACANALAAVLDALETKEATVLGFSFGGVVAQLAAKTRPDLIRRLIAYGCLSPLVGRPMVPPALATALIYRHFGMASWEDIQTRFAALCCLTPHGQAAVRREMAPVGKTGFMAMARANLEAADRGGDFRIRGGVDLLAGARDSNGEAIWRTFSAFEAAYPDARKVLIPEAGHCAHLDQPDAFATALDGLLASREP